MRALPHAILAAAVLATASPADAQLWNPFRSKKSEPSRVRQASHQAAVATDLKLGQEAGPWLIMATTFSGEGAEEQARRLAGELRAEHGMSTYVHEVSFDFTGGEQVLGRGLDKYGEPVKMRYRSGESKREWAVLVGDFPAVDDTLAERTLQRIKSIYPASLIVGPDGTTSQNYATIRRRQQEALKQLGNKGVAEGPMRTAFVTRNPLLPKEYFVPKGVDKFVAKMNKGVEHSLLDAEGRYTVKVATFRGRGVFQGATMARSSAAKRGKKKQESDALVEAAENAHALCEAMRAQGWDAYEFHDRTESYVTVGSFDTIDRRGSDLGPEGISSLGECRTEIVEIFRTFGASFDTPITPLDRCRSAPINSARAERVKETFNQLFTSEVGQITPGVNPKYAQVAIEPGKPLRPVPFDVSPVVIEAPKKTVSGFFAWGR